MCTGPYKLGSWKAGDDADGRRQRGLLGHGAQAEGRRDRLQGRAGRLEHHRGLLTGEINGTYAQPLSTLDQLKASAKVDVYEGPSFASDAFVVSSLKGALGDVRVRQALSLAIDRRAYIDAVYNGAALLPTDARQPGHVGLWQGRLPGGLGQRCPSRTHGHRRRPRQLIKEAGADGKTITIGMSSEIAQLQHRGQRGPSGRPRRSG